jgi:hypothetical protein
MAIPEAVGLGAAHHARLGYTCSACALTCPVSATDVPGPEHWPEHRRRGQVQPFDGYEALPPRTPR